ncbi:hypothetical protein Q7P37_003442 [Cladosporium fusiforme]
MNAQGNEQTAIPGPGWRMLWSDNFNEFQLDIVAFLAVLGEGSILSTAQISALSCLFYLPRLIPAPQALLRTTRPAALPSEAATITAVHSGNIKEHIPQIAHVLLSKEMPPFAVRCVSVKIDRKLRARPLTRADILLRGQPNVATLPTKHDLPLVKLKAMGPLAGVTLLGFFISLALFIVSLVLGDGMSFVATLLLSGLSTLVGISNKWELRLPRHHNPSSKLPAGDVVIRYPNKSFLVVFCEEEVARELFWAVDEIKYHIRNGTTYRMISLVGTLMLMLGVVVLANAKLPLKFCWTGAFLILNAVHWGAAALPQHWHWDFSCLKVEEQGISGGSNNGTYMEALGKAIIVTKSVEWVRLGRAVPFTHKWDDWLAEAERAANTVGSDRGIVKDCLWKSPGQGNTGIVWGIPSADQWTARGSWDKINGHADESEEQGSNRSSEPTIGATDHDRTSER